MNLLDVSTDIASTRTVPAWRRPHWRMLCYHSVTPEDADGLRAQIEQFQALGFSFCRVSEGVAAMATNTLDRPWLTITFDDADRSTHQVAMPILLRAQVPACVFVVPDYVRRGTTYRDDAPRPAMGWSELREWLAAGLEVGSHSLTHAPMRLCSAARFEQECVDAQSILQDALRIPVRHFAYPWGQHSRTTLQWLRGLSVYDSAATIRRGPMGAGWDPLHLRRDLACPSMAPDALVRRMRWADHWYWLRHLRPAPRGYWTTHPELRWDARVELA